MRRIARVEKAAEVFETEIQLKENQQLPGNEMSATLRSLGGKILQQKNVVTVGVEPAISSLRFYKELPATVLRPSITTEAADAIKAVTASYGYKPERSCLRGQAGATIASKKICRGR